MPLTAPSIPKLPRHHLHALLLALGLTLAACAPVTPPRPAAASTSAPVINRFEVGKVTYLTLTPDVELTASVVSHAVASPAPSSNAVVSHAPSQKLALEFTITEPLRERRLAATSDPLTLAPTTATLRRAVLPVRLERMAGLLARARLLDPATGRVLAEAQRPFDATADLRTNFRYAGETYANIEKKLVPRLIGAGKTGDDFWEHIPVGTTPAQELDALYACYQNAAEVSVEEDRGHFTCYEGGRQFWTKSAYLARDFWLFGLSRINALYHGGDRRGIYMIPWTDGKGAGLHLFDKAHPWIDRANPNGYYPGSWLMNLDPAFRRPLTPAELKLSPLDLHGANSWLEYVVEDIFRMSQYYKPRVIWWDNSYGGSHIEYSLNLLRARWADSGATPPWLMINGDAGFHSDIYWIERNLPPTLDAYLAMLRALIDERPAVKRGAATLSIGQDHPRVASGAQEAITDPGNLYHDPRFAFMYRQLLFEAMAADPRIVHQQQWPRNALEWRILHFPAAYREHAKTWGFQTLFEHVYHARDVIPYPQADRVKVLNVPAAYDHEVTGGAVHLVARSTLSDPDTIYLHLFNYVGTRTSVIEQRPHPAPQPAVAIRLAVPGFAREYRVRAFSPDFARFGDQVRPPVRARAAELEFSVPVDTYTLVVIDKPRP